MSYIETEQRMKKLASKLTDTERWALRQVLAGDEARYYGDNGTIHQNGELNVGVDDQGQVVAVWFRCQMLPFTQYNAREDDCIGEGNPIDNGIQIFGVEVSQ